MKAGQLLKLANRNSLHFDSSLISARSVEKSMLFCGNYINCGFGILFFPEFTCLTAEVGFLL